jgi:hypothetical protein
VQCLSFFAIDSKHSDIILLFNNLLLRGFCSLIAVANFVVAQL